MARAFSLIDDVLQLDLAESTSRELRGFQSAIAFASGARSGYAILEGDVVIDVR